MQKIYETAFRCTDPLDGERYQEGCFETQGLISRFVTQFNERQKMNNVDDDDTWNKADDDDIIGIEMSDEENNEESKNGNTNAILDLLQQMISPIKAMLQKDSIESIQN